MGGRDTRKSFTCCSRSLKGSMYTETYTFYEEKHISIFKAGETPAYTISFKNSMMSDATALGSSQ